jgi:hypothetical protein
MLGQLEVDHVNKNQDFMQPKPAIRGPQLARGKRGNPVSEQVVQGCTLRIFPGSAESMRALN